jgi:outer membrane receptor protein involved in Fe transport
MTKTLLRFARLAPLALLFAGVAGAQTTSTITGTVTDGSTGKGVVGAVVVATTPAVAGEKTAVTDAKGAYTLSGLAPGKYTVSASFEGYKADTRADLVLGENVTLRANLAIVPEAVQMEEVVVTGSRIRRKDLTTPAPVTVVNREQMATSGKMSLGDFLQTMPEQGNTVNAQVNNGNDGSVRVDLRSLGSNRTLVIVNGRRMVAGGTGADSGPDLNTIPAAAVERIEILKDGASAVYGSDAISGVVNVILKKRFNGTEVSAYGGTSSRSDGNNYDLSAITGVGNEKGNILFSIGYQRSMDILARDRAFSATTYDYNFATGNKSETGNSTTFPSGRFSLPAAVCAAPSANPLVTSACQARSDALANIGSGIIVPQFDPATGKTTGYKGYTGNLYNTNPTNFLVTPGARVQLFSTGDVNLGGNTRAFYETSFVDRKSATTLAPMPLVNNTIPTNVVTVSKDSVYNPFGVDITSWRHRTTEFGNRYYAQNVDTMHLVAGLDGSLGDWAGPLKGWTWDAAYNFGRTWSVDTSTGQLSMSRVANATGPSMLDANGKPVCVRVPGQISTKIGGCVPMNVLGGEGAIDPASAAYVSFTGVNRGTDGLDMVSANLAGELFKLLSDRPVGLALGTEYRRESASYQPDPVTASLDSSGNNQLPTAGNFDVKEAFAELSFPIMSHVPFVEDLELSLAGRIFKYNLFGADKTYKVGARYSPFRDLTLRGTWSTAFRAPNVGELFGGTADDYPTVRDTCNGPLAAKSATQAQRCADQGVLPTGSADSSTQLLTKRGSNSNLKPETAKTLTAGVVVEPRWVPGLSVTLDYYRVEVDKAIATHGAASIMAACYDGSAATAAAFCPRIIRDPSTHTVTFIDDQRDNINTFKTAGLDFSARYSVPTEVAGRFLFAVDGNLLQYYRITDFTGQTISAKGTYDEGVLPDLKMNVGVGWSFDKLGAGASVRYIGAIKECASGLCAADATDARKVEAYYPVNVYVSYSTKWSAGTTTLLAGVQNTFDVQPPYLYNAAAANSDPSTYDYLGRYFYARLTQSF